MIDLGTAEFVKMRLNLGRSHGQKAANIRALLKDSLGLEGRAIRDLTVRDTNTLFQAPEEEFERICGILEGKVIGGITVAVTRAEGSRADLRVPPPTDLEGGDEAAEAAEAAEAVPEVSTGEPVPEGSSEDAAPAQLALDTVADDSMPS